MSEQASRAREPGRTALAFLRPSASPLAAVALGVALLRFAHQGLYMGVRPGGGETDLRPAYAAARMVLDRAGGSVYDPQRVLSYQLLYAGDPGAPYMPFLYPPPALLVYLPLAVFPFPVAAKLWLLANLVGLGPALYWCARLAGPRPEAMTAVVAVALLLAATPHTISLGQVNVWVLACLLGMVRSLADRRDVAAGAYLSGAIMLKLTPALFIIYLLTQRRWRAALTCIAFSVALLAVAWAAFGGVASPVAWLQQLQTHGAWAAAQPNNQSLTGLLCGMGLPGGRSVALALGGLLAALAVLTWLWTFVPAAGAPRIGLHAGLGAAVAVLASPVTMPHHYLSLLIGFAALFSVWEDLARRPSILAAAALCIGGLSLQYDWNRPAEGLSGLLSKLLVYPLVGWGVVAYVCMLVVILRLYAPRPQPTLAVEGRDRSPASPEAEE